MDLFNQLPDLSRMSYQEVFELCQKCTRCALGQGRKKVVFGEGPVPCNLMLIGEAPGEAEDNEGRPFVGRAGQLLTKILASQNISREKDIYITNIVKCRPPGNRTPYPQEVKLCYPYLSTQIKLVSPKIILLAGAPATACVLKTKESITQTRGRWFTIEGGISAMPIYHPSYLLRNQSNKQGSPRWQTWQDMIEIRGSLDYFEKLKKLEENHSLKEIEEIQDKRRPLKSLLS